MNALEISTLLIVSVGLLVGLFVWYSKRNGSKLPQCVLDTLNNNVASQLFLPTDATGDTCAGVNMATNVLVFRSQMYNQQQRTNYAQGFSKSPWILPNKGTVVSQDYLSALFPSTGGLYTYQSALQQGLPWPPVASAQMISQQTDPTKLPDTLTNPLQQNASNALPTLDGQQPIGISIPDWPNVPANGQRDQPSTANAFVSIAGINDPEGADAQLNAGTTQQNFFLGAISVQFRKSGTVQVECAGGNGGYFLTGTKQDRNLLQQQGGRNGIVWAQVQVKAGDTWYVQLSQDGTAQTRNAQEIQDNISVPSSKPSGGGQGSFLAGSEGGGSTWISTKPPCLTTQNPTQAQCPEIGSSHDAILMAAAGGGGASRNAQGGPAGCSLIGTQYAAVDPNPNTTPFLKNLEHPNAIFQGFPGGPINVPTTDTLTTPPVQSSLLNDLSGGGGGQHKSKEGESWNAADFMFVPKELRGPAKKQSRGHPLKGGDGTDDPPGGGGGGAGYKGGGAGIWNQLAAPNNIHGAGGGGSSYVSPSARIMSSSSEQLSVKNGNPYQAPNWRQVITTGTKSTVAQTSNSTLVFEPCNYFLLGVPDA